MALCNHLLNSPTVIWTLWSKNKSKAIQPASQQATSSRINSSQSNSCSNFCAKLLATLFFFSLWFLFFFLICCCMQLGLNKNKKLKENRFFFSLIKQKPTPLNMCPKSSFFLRLNILLWLAVLSTDCGLARPGQQSLYIMLLFYSFEARKKLIQKSVPSKNLFKFYLTT